MSKSLGLNVKSWLLLLCALVFVVGVVMVYQTANSRKKLYRQLIMAERALIKNAPVCLDLEKIEENIEAITVKSDHFRSRIRVPDIKELDGIGLSSSIQSLIHDYRILFSNRGIEVMSHYFGFEDFTREVALISDENELIALATEISLVKMILNELIHAEPISVLEIERKTQKGENPGGIVRDLTTGMSTMATAITYRRYQVSVDFEAYTRSIRSMINHLNEIHLPLKLCHLKVSKSNKSEVDHTSEIFSEVSTYASDKMKNTSPFARFIQFDGDVPSGKQTKPLIGELVSRVYMTFELVQF